MWAWVLEAVGLEPIDRAEAGHSTLLCVCTCMHACTGVILEAVVAPAAKGPRMAAAEEASPLELLARYAQVSVCLFWRGWDGRWAVLCTCAREVVVHVRPSPHAHLCHSSRSDSYLLPPSPSHASRTSLLQCLPPPLQATNMSAEGVREAEAALRVGLGG